jgi:hypothetical protein
MDSALASTITALAQYATIAYGIHEARVALSVYWRHRDELLFPARTPDQRAIDFARRTGQA